MVKVCSLECPQMKQNERNINLNQDNEIMCPEIKLNAIKAEKKKKHLKLNQLEEVFEDSFEKSPKIQNAASNEFSKCDMIT